MTQENLGAPHGLPKVDLVAVKQSKAPIPYATFTEKLLATPNTLRVNSGHLDDIAASPVGALIVSPSEIYHIERDSVSLGLVAGIEEAKLLQRLKGAPNEAERNQALTLMTYVLEQESAQKSLAITMRLAKLKKSEERIAVAREDIQQLNVISSIHTTLQTTFGDAYITSDPGRFAVIEQNLSSDRSALSAELDAIVPENPQP